MMDQGASIKNLEAGADGRVNYVKLEDGTTIEADTVSFRSYTSFDIWLFYYCVTLRLTSWITSEVFQGFSC